MGAQREQTFPVGRRQSDDERFPHRMKHHQQKEAQREIEAN
jgi:hypothetical protein